MHIFRHIALVRHLRCHKASLLQATISLCSSILRWCVETTVGLILVLDLDVLGEVFLDFAIHFAQVLVC